MAPGPRKKNYNRKANDHADDSKRNVKIIYEPQSKEMKDTPRKDIHEATDSLIDKSYSKRSLASNWERYEEPVPDLYADKMRGEDFAVLSSYCGGSESQMKLQEERDWEENVNDKSVTVDLQDLVKAVKSIPFHKQIDVPRDIFSEEQLSRFVSSAENYSEPIKAKSNVVSTDKKIVKEAECIVSDDNIIESYEPEETVDFTPSKIFTLEEKTENIIESLASCLSLKNAAPPEKNVKEAQLEKEKHSSAIPDDLDFLLSLSVTTKNPKQEEKSSKKQTNVDDWLNSILDD